MIRLRQLKGGPSAAAGRASPSQSVPGGRQLSAMRLQQDQASCAELHLEELVHLRLKRPQTGLNISKRRHAIPTILCSSAHVLSTEVLAMQTPTLEAYPRSLYQLRK